MYLIKIKQSWDKIDKIFFFFFFNEKAEFIQTVSGVQQGRNTDKDSALVTYEMLQYIQDWWGLAP